LDEIKVEDLEDEKIEHLKEIVSEGEITEKQIVLMQTMLLTTMHPHPPQRCSNNMAK
jgi:hypothetical protein